MAMKKTSKMKEEDYTKKLIFETNESNVELSNF